MERHKTRGTIVPRVFFFVAPGFSWDEKSRKMAVDLPGKIPDNTGYSERQGTGTQ